MMGQINLKNSSVVEESIPLCYESLNGSCPKIIQPPVIRFALYLFLWAAVLVTVFGNMLVIIAVIHFKQLHTPTNYLIMSLAVSDFLVGGIVMPPSVIKSVESCWYFGDLNCKILFGLDVMCCTASILNLSLISIDRYYAIGHPLSYGSNITFSVIAIMLCFVWAISTMLCVGIVIHELSNNIIDDFNSSVTCVGACIVIPGEAWTVASSALSFYLPGVILTCVYLKIYHIAQQQSRSIHNMQLKWTDKKQASRMERKATKTLAIVMGVFLLCWLPIFLCNTLVPFTGYTIDTLWYDVLIWIGYFNSACNPLIYALFYGWFRKAFGIILSGKITTNAIIKGKFALDNIPFNHTVFSLNLQ